MKNEYNRQCACLLAHEKHFRKIGRKQIQDRALRKHDITDTTGDLTQVIRRGTKALVMTDELVGLYRKINRCRRMLKMKEVHTPRSLLL